MHKTLLKSLNISLSPDLFVALRPSVSRFNGRGWKIKVIQFHNNYYNNSISSYD